MFEASHCCMTSYIKTNKQTKQMKNKKREGRGGEEGYVGTEGGREKRRKGRREVWREEGREGDLECQRITK